MSEHCHRPERALSREDALAVAPQAEVHVAARPGAVLGVLRHERDGQPHPVGRLLQALLEDHVPVRHLHGLGVADVHLVLSESPLALRALHGHAGFPEMPAHRRREGLRARTLEHVVILEIPPGRLQSPVVALGGVAVALGEDVVLQL